MLKANHIVKSLICLSLVTIVSTNSLAEVPIAQISGKWWRWPVIPTLVNTRVTSRTRGLHHLASGRRHLAALVLHPEHWLWWPHAIVFSLGRPGTNRRQLEAERHCHDGRHGVRWPCASAVFRDDAQCLRWTLRQRQIIFRLLLEDFGWMIGSRPKDDHRRVATLWRVTVEARLRRQGLISVRQKQNQKVSTNFPGNWSHN